MNEAHEYCGSDEWRQLIREVIIPWALGEVDLSDDVLEVGPGYGATTDVFGASVPRLTSVEIDDELAAMLRERFAGMPSIEIVHGDATRLAFVDGRFNGAACFTMLHHVPTVELQDRLFAEVARVLRPGAALVASDSLGSDELAVAQRRHVQPGRPGDAARPPGSRRLRRCSRQDDGIRLAAVARR
jgi:SAM-dependent methyltransferase